MAQRAHGKNENNEVNEYYGQDWTELGGLERDSVKNTAVNKWKQKQSVLSSRLTAKKLFGSPGFERQPFVRANRNISTRISLRWQIYPDQSYRGVNSLPSCGVYQSSRISAKMNNCSKYAMSLHRIHKVIKISQINRYQIK